MAEADNKHPYKYDPAFIADILGRVRSVAIVGASGDARKPSYQVMQFLQARGYRVFPVNPHTALKEINGERVYGTLDEIEAPVDMVDVFRPRQELYDIAQQAIAIGAKVLWGQLAIYDDRAAALAENAGLQVVMDRCPKIELEH